LINRTITRDYSAANDPVVRRRPIGLHVGTNEYVTTWGYDDTGRLSRVTGPGLPGNGVLYAYEDDSDLVAVTRSHRSALPQTARQEVHSDETAAPRTT